MALGVGVLLVLAVAAVAMAGRAHLAVAQAQAAADTAALSAGRRLVDVMDDMAAEHAPGRARWMKELRAAAEQSAAAGGARIVEVRVPKGQAWPPAAVEVVVERGGPVGTRVRAVARVGLAVYDVMREGPRGLATGGGYSGPLVYRDGKPICPALAAALDPMAAAARADGVSLRVVSGFRSDAEQAVLFARHPDPRWVAPPGRSRHRDATEIDFGGAGAYAWLARNAERFGFVQRYSWEPWHYGFVAGCGDGAASTRDGRQDVIASALLPAWVPEPYRALVLRAATQNGLAPTLLAALLQAESGFDPRAVSPAGAQGIAQFMPATARGMGLDDPLDPAQAIPAAARLLSGHVRALGSIPLALAAYNAGPGAVRRYGGVPPYRETQAYVARILAIAGGGALVSGSPGGGVILIRAGDRLV